ncbi:MAG TPA: CsgE family curli-type amyloid fiber assembly protein [Dyella sp.]|uniref:CsgE family curli-type amyloid fiber assembly protein n=1 Tax=Dyella sp. TaxID=1869338 RepID=UPI002D78442C|nr:CsgE family curli-type amyloid fiber assembly protein [Dyella sp.]HET6555208.1 CsgE family curli-type amyloid fiber assembly protein [Dyella sp.]
MLPALVCVAISPAWAGTDQESLLGKAAPVPVKAPDVMAGLAPALDFLDKGIIEGESDALIERPLDETAASTVIADQTITQTGRQFVHGFEQAWRNRDGLAHVSIAISERPSARWGSVIRVEENFALIYQVVLFPGRGDPLAVGAEAAQMASKKASAIEAERLLFKDQDLGAEEL